MCVCVYVSCACACVCVCAHARVGVPIGMPVGLLDHTVMACAVEFIICQALRSDTQEKSLK